MNLRLLSIPLILYMLMGCSIFEINDRREYSGVTPIAEEILTSRAKDIIENNDVPLVASKPDINSYSSIEPPPNNYENTVENKGAVNNKQGGDKKKTLRSKHIYKAQGDPHSRPASPVMPSGCGNCGVYSSTNRIAENAREKLSSPKDIGKHPVTPPNLGSSSHRSNVGGGGGGGGGGGFLGSLINSMIPGAGTILDEANSSMGRSVDHAAASAANVSVPSYEATQEKAWVLNRGNFPTSNVNPASISLPISYGDQEIVEVFFSTDRNLLPSSKLTKFGSDRGDLKYGTAQISIPRSHMLGRLESPSYFRLEFTSDMKKHIVLTEAHIHDREFFFKQLTKKINSSSKKNSFIFIHGYNVSFEDAARRTAQISYDLNFDGAAVFYSWPSKGNMKLYTVDGETIAWSQGLIAKFLKEFLSESGAENIYLIAHSMGNRALSGAIMSLSLSDPNLALRIKEIILTAPDIDAGVFKRDIAPVLVKASRAVTLYASSNDKALAASRQIHGYQRAGQSGSEILVLPGIETIDATNVDTDFIGHSYFANSILGDIYNLIQGQRASSRFGLRPIRNPPLQFWTFRQ